MTLPIADIQAPVIDYKELSPLMATVGGSIVVLMVGLLRGRFVQTLLVPILTAVSLLTAMGLTIWIWDPGVQQPIVEGSLTVDTLALGIAMLVYVAGLVCVKLSWRSTAAREAGHGEYHSMLLGSISGMVVLAAASDLITVFVGLELLSIPLYVLCAAELRRRTSLEAGLKYLVIGSVGSATLLYGLALIYGATGAMQFDAISEALNSGQVSLTDPLLLTGIGLIVAGPSSSGPRRWPRSRR
jgi:NADH-quinone oxidoreductase subunit N